MMRPYRAMYCVHGGLVKGYMIGIRVRTHRWDSMGGGRVLLLWATETLCRLLTGCRPEMGDRWDCKAASVADGSQRFDLTSGLAAAANGDSGRCCRRGTRQSGALCHAVTHFWAWGKWEISELITVRISLVAICGVICHASAYLFQDPGWRRSMINCPWCVICVSTASDEVWYLSASGILVLRANCKLKMASYSLLHGPREFSTHHIFQASLFHQFGRDSKRFTHP